MRKSYIALQILLLTAVSTILYFWGLGKFPPGLYIDEATTGYNAYSLLTTGKDEYGEPWPVALRFFGSYTPPLYTYLTVPVISVLRLNIAAVRVVSALTGVATTLLVFLFLRKISALNNQATPFFGALLFAISPWSVLYSRAGYELNLGFFLFSSGAAISFLGLRRPLFLTVSLIILSLSTYGAHAQLYLVPLFLFLFYLVFRKQLQGRKNKNLLLLGLIFAALIQIPHLKIIFTSAFFPKSTLFYFDLIKQQAEKLPFLPSFLAIPLAFAYEFLSRFATYFSPRSLFFNPDPDLQRSLPDLSVFYPWMVIPYVLGIIWLFKNRKTQIGKFLLLLLAITPLPASLTLDPFSTQRALPLLFPMILLITLGIDEIARKLGRKTVIFLFSVLTAFSLVLLWRSYFVLLPGERAQAWNYGFKQLADEVRSRPGERFIVDQARIKPAYIELAFFLSYPPERLQAETDQSIRENYYNNTVFDPNYSFGNIETRSILWEEDIYKKQILIGDELSISDQQAQEHFLIKIFEIRDPIGQVVFKGYKTNPSEKCVRTSFKNPLCKI